MKTLSSAIVLFTFALPASAEIKIDGPTEVPRGGLCILRVSGLAKDQPMSWAAAPADIATVDLLDRNGAPVLFVPTDRDGTWHLVLAYSDREKLAQKVHTVRVGSPTPPVPPAPIPPAPIPPGPTPPGPAPLPISGFRVFILEETADRNTSGALNVLASTKIREYLNARCAKGPDGKTPEWRLWDDDLSPGELSHAPENWRKAFERAKADSRGTLPWLIVSDGTRGESRPLPKTEAETLAILHAYGGN